MMLKVLVYAYTQRIYSSRQIAKGLRENVNFMWLSGGNRPDFWTINEFLGEKMRDVIEEVYTSVLELLVEEGYVKLENYFVDGSKVEAHANRHKVVWTKSRAKYQQRRRLPKNISADAGYGNEENYTNFEEHRLGNYVKYNTFHREQQKHRKPELIRKAIFRSENFSYEAETDISGHPSLKNRERLLDRNTHVRTRQPL